MASAKSSARNQSTQKSGGKPQKAAPAASASDDNDVEDDELFGLVSVLYHALQGASAARKYISDAQSANDDELREFFERCRTDDASRASEAKRLLVLRVDEEEGEGDEGEDDDEDDEDDDEDEDEGEG